MNGDTLQQMANFAHTGMSDSSVVHSLFMKLADNSPTLAFLCLVLYLLFKLGLPRVEKFMSEKNDLLRENLQKDTEIRKQKRDGEMAELRNQIQLYKKEADINREALDLHVRKHIEFENKIDTKFSEFYNYMRDMGENVKEIQTGLRMFLQMNGMEGSAFMGMQGTKKNKGGLNAG